MIAGLLGKENILFFTIVGIIFLIVFVVFFLIIKSFIGFITNIFKKLFHKYDRDKRIGVDSGEDVDVVIKELQESKNERQRAELDTALNATIFGPTTHGGEILDKKEPEVNQEQKFEEKNRKEIEGGLDKLKGEATEEEFMQKINVPRQKDAGQNSEILGKKEPEEPGKYSIKEGDVPFKQMGIVNNSGPVFRAINPKPGELSSKQTITFFEKPDFINDTIGPHSAHKTPLEKSKSIGLKDASIFGGKEEISRENLRDKLEGFEVYKVGKSVGLKLNSIERSNLEKEVFSQNLGQNISRTDLKRGIRKLNDKLLGSKNISERGEIRKKINFFKKIGGVK
jgi:hypothetical protein